MTQRVKCRQKDHAISCAGIQSEEYKGMDAEVVKYIVLGIVGVAAFGVAPIVMALLAHQQKMAALFAKQSLDASELIKRIEILERRLGATAPAIDAPQDETPVRRS